MRYLWPAVAAGGFFSAAYFLYSYIPPRTPFISRGNRWKELHTARELMRAEFLGETKTERRKASKKLRRMQMTSVEREFIWACVVAKLKGTTPCMDMAPPRFGDLPDCTLDYGDLKENKILPD
jgi:hypothetical protein